MRFLSDIITLKKSQYIILDRRSDSLIKYAEKKHNSDAIYIALNLLMIIAVVFFFSVKHVVFSLRQSLKNLNILESVLFIIVYHVLIKKCVTVAI